MLRFWRKEEGQTLVELALVLPILLMLVLGIVEFGRVYGTYLALVHTAREGARAASIGADDTEIQDVLLNNSPLLDPVDLTMDIDPPGSRSTGQQVTITLGYPVDIEIPFVPLGGTIDLTAQTVMRVE